MGDGTPMLRLLVVMPSWVGDAVMATPAIRRIREARAGIFIGALMRPTIEQVLRGSDLFDEVHTYTPHGMMAPKKAAAKVRGRRYDTAVLLTNSFSTALSVRMAFIPRRIGYERDGRGVLLTDRVRAPRDRDGWKMVPAVDYYWNLANVVLGEDEVDWGVHVPTDCVSLPLALDPGARMELPVLDADRVAAHGVLESAGVGPGEDYALLNPGGNNEKKRWAADRFARLGDWMSREFGLKVVLNGSPGERDLLDEIVSLSETGVVSLVDHGSTLGAVRAIIGGAKVMVTNDTGPRHMGVALGVPVVSLFGPTDPRWTTVPVDRFGDGSPKEIVLVADESLPAEESANDHPERCAIGVISEERVRAAVGSLLARSN